MSEAEKAIMRIAWISYLQQQLDNFNLIHGNKERYKLVEDNE